MPKIEADVVLSLGEHLPAVDVWLVVDVLRASTVIVRWFELGGGTLMPVSSTNDARKLAVSLTKGGQAPLLMGEEDAIAPKGFDLGNSPSDLTENLVKSRSCAVMATSNGTGALLAAAATGVPVLTACIRNARAAVTHALTFGSHIGILCAGRKSRPAWDDTLCAGLLLETLADSEPNMLLADSARLALLTLQSSPSLLKSMRSSDHAIFLDKLGYGPDIAFACERDATTVVPVLYEEPEHDMRDGGMRAVLKSVTVKLPDIPVKNKNAKNELANSFSPEKASVVVAKPKEVATATPSSIAQASASKKATGRQDTVRNSLPGLSSRSFTSLLEYTAANNGNNGNNSVGEQDKGQTTSSQIQPTRPVLISPLQPTAQPRSRTATKAPIASTTSKTQELQDTPFFLGGIGRKRDRMGKNEGFKRELGDRNWEP